MNKTKVDDILIEMITPKITEIENKFSKGEGLNNDDINLLLLKSQYNHINHLDEKLNEVVADNAKLELKFEQRMGSLENKMEQRMGSLENEFANLRTEFANLRTEFANLKTDIQVSINSTMRWYIGGAGAILIALKALDLFIK